MDIEICAVKKFDNITQYLPNKIVIELLRLSDKVKLSANEIRIRCGKPVVVMMPESYVLPDKNHILTQNDISEIFQKLCDYSVYSYQAELSQGFITLPGGHRVGICGTASLDKSGNRTVKYISSINIRIASEHIGCARELVNEVFSEKLCGALIAGPPCCGKTTILRDIALNFSSEGSMKKVVIVDERGELAAIYRGTPQNTLGLFCDVLNGYPKGEGILIALRTLSPDVIICDEVGSEEDAKALCEGVNAGVAVISSVHACNADELYTKNSCKRLLETGAFKKIVFLKGGRCRGIVESIIEVQDKLC
ncbi:MAG: ATPase, T2SS/T4P/T4SS family [Acutalibacteraceae bacterium]